MAARQAEPSHCQIRLIQRDCSNGHGDGRRIVGFIEFRYRIQLVGDDTQEVRAGRDVIGNLHRGSDID